MTDTSRQVLPLAGRSKENSFLRSALTLANPFQPLAEVLQWLSDRQQSDDYEVSTVPLEDLTQWSIDPVTGNVSHETGRFFSVEGIRVTTNFPGTPGSWDQPIIVQPEVGVLGMLTRVVDDVRYFLVQAKMEPGNVNMVQLSPTVQATKSNFTQAHKGTRPPFLDYFFDPNATVLLDQLQSEQGSRFLRKRNRNMIVETSEEIPDDPNYRWLTLGELKALTSQYDDLVNMDARTVLSCVQLIDDDLARSHADLTPQQASSDMFDGGTISDWGADLTASLLASKRCLHSVDQIMSWFTQLKTVYELTVERIPINDVAGWRHRGGRIAHDDDRFFSVVGVEVEARGREVHQWGQPILHHEGLGIVGFVAQRINGVLHFLVHGKVEPGIMDTVEMGPTVSIFDVDRRAGDPIPFLPFFVDPPQAQVRYSRIHSEEGGRFLNLRNIYQVVEVPSDEKLDIPGNYVWMTLSQIMGFIRYNNYFNIEARGLLAGLDLVGRREAASVD